jgi:hypothetical protein
MEGVTEQVATKNAKAKRGIRVPLRRCCYCGAWSAGPVCRAHTDLLFLDQRELEKRAS